MKDGRCELGDRDCAWVQIYDRLESQGRGDSFDDLGDTKDNSINSMTCEWDMNPETGGLEVSLKQALACGEFVVTSEVGPPKGIDIAEMMHAAEGMRSRVHAINVTDNQAAVMRLSTIAACIHLKQAGFDPVLQVTGRDRNRIGIQSDLLGAASFGVTTVLALTGDHTVVGDHKEAKPVFDLDSVQILETVAALNSGTDLMGNELHRHAGAARGRGGHAGRPPARAAARQVRQEGAGRRAVLPDAGGLQRRELPRLHGARAQAPGEGARGNRRAPLGGNGPLHEQEHPGHRRAARADPRARERARTPSRPASRSPRGSSARRASTATESTSWRWERTIWCRSCSTPPVSER